MEETAALRGLQAWRQDKKITPPIIGFTPLVKFIRIDI
ncbi:hypothetical protein B398_08675 [Xylella fastidiosa 32]|nr:hypothetical protein B398_08675 [Xylella fastidiosa 32]